MTISTHVDALDYLSQLGKETLVSYSADAKTVGTIIDEILALQVLTPVITRGTIDSTIAAYTRSIQADGWSILQVLQALRDTAGGYIEVNNDRQLQWSASVGEDKGQQLRYRKNTAGFRRTIDYTTLANRVYAYGSSGISLPAPGYIEDVPSQIAYGGIYAKSFSSSAFTFEVTVQAWAVQLLALYKIPLISYEIDVANLALDLDFSFDALQLGSTVKVIDEDLGIDVSARVIRIDYQDITNPTTLHVLLSNRMRDLVDLLGNVYEQQALYVAPDIDASQIISGNIATDRIVVNAGNAVNAGAVVINASKISLTGKTIDEISDGVTYKRTKSVAIDANGMVLLDQTIGGAYSLVLSTDISAGHIKLDSVEDGIVYKKVLATQITAGQLYISSSTVYAAGYDPSNKEQLIQRGTTPPADTTKLWLDTSVVANVLKRYSGGIWIPCSPTTIDEIGDGTTYRRVSSAALSATGMVLLDSVVVGTYGLVRSTQIQAGEIVLTSGTMRIDKQGILTALSGSRVELTAAGLRGYYGSTLQVEINSATGSLWACNGGFVVDASIVRLTGQYLYFVSGADYGGIYQTSTALYITGSKPLRINTPVEFDLQFSTFGPRYTAWGYCGDVTNYWGYGYFGTLRMKSIDWFDTHDDIALIKQMKPHPSKPDKTDQSTIPTLLLSDTKGEAEKNCQDALISLEQSRLEQINEMNKHPGYSSEKRVALLANINNLIDGKKAQALARKAKDLAFNDEEFVDAGAMLGLAIGAIRQLAERVEALEKGKA